VEELLMFRKFYDWLSSGTQTKSRKFRNRQLRRDRFRQMLRQSSVEALEPRQMLTTAYIVPGGTSGNQDWTGALGMDFEVNSPITINQLGVFDDDGDGLASSKSVRLYDRNNTATPVVSVTIPAAGGTLIDSSRFVAIPPVFLPAGFEGSIVADGFDATDMNGNSGGADTVAQDPGAAFPWFTDDGGGLITFTGGARRNVAPGGYPTDVDGGPVNRYAAGTFEFSAATNLGSLFFSVDGNSNGLYTLDPNTGDAAIVGFGITGVTGATVGLTESGDPSFVYGSTPLGLRTINADGSGSTQLGSTGIEGLARNPTTGFLYGAINGSFFTLDPATGAIVTTLASPGADVEGLEYGNGLIYGLADGGDLSRYDIGANTWSLIGSTGVAFDNVGLAYDAVQNVLYAKGNQDNNLYSIDPDTAVATFVGNTGIAVGGGLTFVSSTSYVATGDIVIDGTPFDDTLVITATTADSGTYQFFSNGQAGPVIPFTGATSFTFNGFAGDDILQVNNPVGGLFAPAGGIFFDGGVGGEGSPGFNPPGDSLEILGGAHTTETHNFRTNNAPGQHSGTIELVNGATTANYDYNNLSPVLVNAGTPNDIIFNLVSGNGDDETFIENAPAAGFSQLRSGSGLFETTVFANPANSLRVNMGDEAAGETATLAVLDAAWPATARIEIFGGTGPDTINIQATPVLNLGVVVSVEAGLGADTINVSSNAPTNTGDLNALNARLELNSGNTNGLDVLNVSESGGAGGDVTIDLDAQVSAFREITGTAGGGWTVRKIVHNFGGGVNFAAGTANNNIYIPSTQAGEALSVSAGTGDDTIVLGAGPTNLPRSLDFIQGDVNIAGDGHVLGDTLELRDDNDLNSNSYTVTDGSVVRPGAANMTFNTVENLSLFAGNQPDAFDITPFAGTVINANGADPAFPTQPGDTLLYRGDGTKTLSSAPGSGVISAPGVGDVHFSSIEEVSTPPGNFLNDVIDLTSLPGGQDGNPNQVVLQRDPSGVWFEILIDFNTNDNGGTPNPILFSRQLFDSIGQITVLGGTDDDELVVSHENGFINRTITFDGAAGFDSLVITGDPGSVAARTTYLASPLTGFPLIDFAGTWVVDPIDSYGPGAVGAAAQGNGRDAMVVNFTGLSPVDDDTPAAVFDAILTGLADDATIQDATVSGFDGLGVVSNTATFEDFFITRKDTIRVMGESGGDVFRINYSTAPLGLGGNPMTGLELYGHLAPLVPGPADDNASDRFALFATAAGVTTSLFGQGGNDLFHNAGFSGDNGPRHLDDIQGPVIFDGGTGGETTGDLVYLTDRLTSALVGDIVEFDDDGTVGTITGAAAVVLTHTNLETLFFESTPRDDVLDVLATLDGTHYILGGDGGSDTFTIGNQTANVGVNPDGSLITDGNGTLANIQGRISVIPDSSSLTVGTDDILNVDASADGALAGAASIDLALNQTLTLSGSTFTGDMTRLSNFAAVDIEYFHGPTAGSLGIGNADNRLEYLNVIASQGEDTIDVNATTATEFTRIDAYLGDDANTMTINGDALSANNLFMGNVGNDQFVLNIAAHLGDTAVYPLTSVEIRGDDPANDSINRDRLIINDNNAGFVRNLDYQYDSANPGGVDIAANVAGAGLAGPVVPGLALLVRTMETVIFNSLDVNDIVRVTGTVDDDLMTVGLRPNDTSALFFLDGTPYLDAPPVTVADSRPGVAGGGNGPDLLINGLDAAAGIYLTGGGASGDGDRAIVYGASENGLVDVGNPTDIFGFGAGVLIPGFGVGSAYDTMTVNDAGVVTSNNAFGPLTTVSIDTASFVQNLPVEATQRPAFIVNGGDEAVAQPSGIADLFNVTPSTFFNIQINGNLPDPATFVNGVPQGDQLNVTFTGSINVFSDDQSPPNVTLTGQTSNGDPPFGVRYSSIERVNLTPGNGIVNIIGDNDTTGAGQNDYFKVRGGRNPLQFPPQNDGVGQFSLQIGGELGPGHR
jgi:hypothetical protein